MNTTLNIEVPQQKDIDHIVLLEETTPRGAPTTIEKISSQIDLTQDYFTEEDEKIYSYASEDLIVHLQSEENKVKVKQKSVFLELLKQIKPGIEVFNIFYI